MTKKYSAALFLSFLFLLAGACTGIPKNIQQPKVDLKDVGIDRANLTDATLLFNFTVQNPNNIPLSVDQIDYALDMNGKPFTKGSLEKGLKVDANSSIQVPLPVAVRFADVMGSLSQLISSGTTPYELKGSVKVGFLSIPFTEKGELKLSDLRK